MIHLDTSFLIRALAAGSPEDSLLRDWLRQDETVGVCAVAWAEFLCGPAQQRQVTLASKVVSEMFPFTADDAAFAAELFNLSGRRRGTLADCMIAAVAHRAGASLATSNPMDFQKLRPAGLRVIAV